MVCFTCLMGGRAGFAGKMVGVSVLMEAWSWHPQPRDGGSRCERGEGISRLRQEAMLWRSEGRASVVA